MASLNTFSVTSPSIISTFRETITQTKSGHSVYFVLVPFVSQTVSQLFHGPTPRSPLHRLSVRLRLSRSNTSTEYSSRGLLNSLPQVLCVQCRSRFRFKNTGGNRRYTGNATTAESLRILVKNPPRESGLQLVNTPMWYRRVPEFRSPGGR